MRWGMRFFGRFNQTLDSKGRLSIPAPLRDKLSADGAGRLVLTCTDRCLEIHTATDWDKLLRKFDRLPQMREDVELFGLFYISSATEIAPDKQGRVLVPQTLRDQVGLKKEIVVVGNKNRIQIFSAEMWDAVAKEAHRRFSEIRNLLSEDLS